MIKNYKVLISFKQTIFLKCIFAVLFEKLIVKNLNYTENSLLALAVTGQTNKRIFKPPKSYLNLRLYRNFMVKYIHTKIDMTATNYRKISLILIKGIILQPSTDKAFHNTFMFITFMLISLLNMYQQSIQNTKTALIVKCSKK